jgi:ABC-type dipeptide/oligopeptide/nickel transport system permease subunit
VVIQLTLANEIDWRAIASGMVPRFNTLFEPAATFAPYLDKLSDTGREFWSTMIVGQQRDVMIGAAATAVGINMTFLLPYSMLRKGWDRDFRGLAIFDLSTGLLIPFMLATGLCRHRLGLSIPRQARPRLPRGTRCQSGPH